MLVKIKTEHKDVATTTADEVLVVKKVHDLQPGDRILVDYAKDWNDVAELEGNKVEGLYRYDPFTVQGVTKHVQVRVKAVSGATWDFLAEQEIPLDEPNSYIRAENIKIGTILFLNNKPQAVTRVEHY